MAQAGSALGSAKEPDLVLVESEKVGAALDDDLDALSANCSPNTRVMLFGADNDIVLYKKLIGLGITDYFTPGASPDQVMSSIEETFLEGDAENQARVIAFIGANGGAGSSVVAANVAYCLAEQYNQPVTLLDLDLSFGVAGLEFDIQSKQSVMEALGQPERLDETLVERFLIPHTENLSVLPSTGDLAGIDELNHEALETLTTLLQQMNSFVVLDLPRTWRPWVRETIIDCDELVIVAQPELVALRNAKNLLDYHLSVQVKNGQDKHHLN